MEELEDMEGLENVEELVGKNEFRTLLVRSSAGGVARVTILVPAIVPVSDLLSLMPLMPFFPSCCSVQCASHCVSVCLGPIIDMYRPKPLARLV